MPTVDTSLWILAAVIPFGMGALGGYLSSNKRLHRYIFGVSGVVGALVVVIAGLRNQNAQANLQSQLDTIQRNTQTPPVINVDANPSYLQLNAVVATKSHGISFLSPNSRTGFNVDLSAVGQVTGASESSDLEVVPVDTGNAQQERQLHEKFAGKAKDLVDNDPGMTVGGRLSMFSTVATPVLDAQEIKELYAGKKRLYLLIYAKWIGANGKQSHLDRCAWMQRPDTKPFNPARIVWHECKK